MISNKLIISFFVLISSIAGSNLYATSLDSSLDGWVSLSRPQQRHFESEGEEDDLSIWAVFSKVLENERFLVRLPEDPTYLHSSEGVFSLRSEREGISHLLEVSKGGEVLSRIEEISSDPACSFTDIEHHSPFLVDLLYEKGGKWIAERLYKTPSNLYLLQTSSDLFNSEAHRKFAHSLDVEPLVFIEKTPSP